MRRMVNISKAENGFVVECEVPYKGEDKGEDNPCRPYGSYEKRYIATSAKQAAKTVEKILPLLDDKYTSEDEFDAAFTGAQKPE